MTSKRLKLLRLTNGYTRIQLFPIAKVIDRIGLGRWSFFAGAKQYNISMNQVRMLLMKQTQKCACCEIEGAYFWLEKNGCFSPHFNLYGHGHEPEESGRPILMTMDHITPKSKGGLTTLKNVQLLCSRCNALKGNDDISLEELRQRRKTKPEPQPRWMCPKCGYESSSKRKSKCSDGTCRKCNRSCNEEEVQKNEK